jgi:hypothetical protein
MTTKTNPLTAREAAAVDQLVATFGYADVCEFDPAEAVALFGHGAGAAVLRLTVKGALAIRYEADGTAWMSIPVPS